MTATITPVAKHTGANITRASAGERMMMDGGAAPLGDVLQTLADRSQYARGATWGTLIGGDDFSVDSGGTNTVFTCRVNAFEAFVAQDTSGVFWPRYSTADTTWTLSDVDGAPANLSADTWYYCYLGVNTDGTLRKQISTSAPIASKKWKTGGTDQWRYFGCFRTISTGAPLPVRITRGRAIYRRGAITNVTNLIASDGLRAKNDSTGVAIGSVSLSARIPPHARVALVSAECSAASVGTAGTNLLHLYSEGDTTSPSVTVRAQASAASGDATYNSTFAELSTTTGQAIGYELVLASDSVTGRLDVTGWQE